MNLRTTKHFDKQYAALAPKVQRNFMARVSLLLHEPDHPSLRRHQLKGILKGLWSINISGDIRALYFEENDEIVFSVIGTHSELYGK